MGNSQPSCEGGRSGQFVILCNSLLQERTGHQQRLQIKSCTNQSYHSSFECSMSHTENQNPLWQTQHLPVDLTWWINNFFFFPSPFLSRYLITPCCSKSNGHEEGEHNTPCCCRRALAWMNRCYGWIPMQHQRQKRCKAKSHTAMTHLLPNKHLRSLN